MKNMGISERFKRAFKGKIKERVNLKNYSYMHTGGYAEQLFLPTAIEDLKLLHEEFNSVDIIGNGSNVLFKGNIDRIAVISDIFSSTISVVEDKITASAGISLPQVARVAYENALSGMEELVGIPGTIGGAIRMNAGAYGKTIFGLLKNITVFNMKRGEITNLNVSQLKPTYRDGGFDEDNIVIEAELKLTREDRNYILNRMSNFSINRRMRQPMGGYSLGSIFKNPKQYPAGWLIETCGLKGKRIGGAFVSQKHANFIINDGTATSKDILDLIDLIRTRVAEKFKVELELEIVLL